MRKQMMWRFAIALGLLLVGCSSGDVEVATEARAETDVAAEEELPDIDVPIAEDSSPSPAGPSTWQEFGSWDAGSSFYADGVDLGILGTLHECFDGECGTPMDYWLTDDFVVPVGSTLQVGDQDLGADVVVVRHLTSDLSFEEVAGSSPMVLIEPGIYHIDVTIEADFENVEGVTQVRHFLWVQVVDPAAPCVAGGAASAVITGVVGSDGCPTEAAALSIESLHPEFHCFPWPPTIEVGGQTYLRHQFSESTVEVPDAVPTDLATTGGVIATGEVLVSIGEPDAVFVRRDDGAVEVWRVDEDGMGCA